MKTVTVAVLPLYRVEVGSKLLERLGERIGERDVAVVTDSQVGPLAMPRLLSGLERTGKRVLPIVVDAGEASKSLTVLETVLGSLAQERFARDCAVVGLGGGMVTDLAGFAAACYLRGVAYYSCPTSLLGMVDASVGGKTGVNLPEGKNLVGAFWQPKLVTADVTTLASLPERRFREGAVELFKHGLLAAGSLLNGLDDADFRPDGPTATLEEYVARSVEVKARVVEQDERETGGRAHLNLGHTLAHALEAESEHRLSHGDAVAYGLLFAALLGRARGWHDYVAECRRLLDWLSPEPLPCREFERLLPFMLRDKKNAAARQRFVLLRLPATPVLVDDVDEAEQRRAWNELLEVLP